jgi:hypothetical protein
MRALDGVAVFLEKQKQVRMVIDRIEPVFISLAVSF